MVKMRSIAFIDISSCMASVYKYVNIYMYINVYTSHCKVQRLFVIEVLFNAISFNKF